MKSWIMCICHKLSGLIITEIIMRFINHIRKLTRKDLMIKNLKRHKKNLEKEGKQEEAASYNFFPSTFHLPSEYPIFYEEFKK